MKDLCKGLKVAVSHIGEHKYRVLFLLGITMTIEAALPIISIWLLGLLVVSLLESTFSVGVLLLIIGYTLTFSFPDIFSYFRERSLLKINDQIVFNAEKATLEKVTQTDLITRKTKNYVDDLNNASYALLQGQIIEFLKQASAGIVGILICVGLIVNIATLHWSLPMIIISLFLLSNYVLGKAVTNYWGIIFNQSTAARQMEAVTGNILSSETAKEIRIFGHYSWLRELWGSYYRKLSLEKVRAGAKYETISNLFSFTLASLPLLVVFFILVTNTRDASYIVSIFATIQLLSARVFPAIGSIAAAKGDSLKLVNLDNFLHQDFSSSQDDLSNLDKETEQETSTDVLLENISFSYPASNEKALKNINLKIPQGSVVCIVGDNGSGKSTLVNVIMGLYRPSEGKVLYKNEHQKSCGIPERMALFQRFLQLKSTVLDNIQIGKHPFKSSNPIENAIEKARANFVLDIGLDTKVGREYGGRDFSGGEWQRIALARTFMRKEGMIVLDEPTSAIDAMTELDIYTTVLNERKDKTVLLVSHRLTSAVDADFIIVMKDGEIIEEGTHVNLIDKNGHYFKMYNSQAAPFLNEVVN